ncbi:MAG: serine/threonine protein kinase [Gemmatimonadales bacterium]|nr:MAG: serine/threonine protein kinase [Gemmatimonadales bacterium]
MTSGGEDREGGTSGPGRAPTDRVGTVLAGRYRILSLLGEGAMGAVWLGEHIRIGRKDAVKVLRPALVRDEEAIARFTRGARNASGLRHPNVCAIYDFGTTEDGAHFLAMEYVDGGNLSDLLDETGRLPVERAVPLLLQAAGALQVAHDREIIHRDLKPDNIMLARGPDGSEQVKVVDFDISLGPPDGEGARVTRHGYVVGTPEYMSPEQLTGDPLGPASDVYALALVFFRMITGRLPFDGGTAQEVMVNRLTVDPMPLAEAAPDAALPPGLEEVFRKALQRKAQDRHPSARALADDVRRAMGRDAASGERAGIGAGSGGGSGAGAGPPPPPGGPAAPGGREAGRPPSAPTPRSGSEAPIPSTRVSSSGDVGGTGGGGDGRSRGPEGSGAGGPARRPSPALLGAAAALIVLLLAGGAWLALSSGGDGAARDSDAVALAGDERADEPDGDDDPAADADADPDPVDPPPAATDTPDPDRTTPDDDLPDPDPVPPATDPAEDEEEGLPRPSELREVSIQGMDVEELLLRQLLAGTEDDDLGPTTLAAVRDSSWAAWSGADMSRADSAMAAYLVGSSMIPLGDSIQGLEWLEEAVRLNPQPGYVNLLDRYRSGGGGR